MTKDRFKEIRLELGFDRFELADILKKETGKGSEVAVRKMEAGLRPVQEHHARAMKLLLIGGTKEAASIIKLAEKQKKNMNDDDEFLVEALLDLVKALI